MKTLLICGASGFIGKNLLINFSKKKKYNIIATYFKSKIDKIPNVKWIKVDLRDEQLVSKITKNVDIVIQAAATTSGSKDIVNQPHIHVTDNALMNSIILRACHKNKIEHFIFFSCTTMYPSTKKNLKEHQYKESKILKNYFGIAHTKLYIEKMCEFFANLKITKHTVIRHSNIYGPFDKFDLNKSHFFGATITKVMTSSNEINVWGEGMEKRDLLYISDLVRFVELSLLKQKEFFKLYNCSYEKAYSVLDIVKKIILASNKNLKIKHDLTKPNLNINILVDSSKAKKELGWYPKVNIDKGIKTTIEWWKANSR
jgi:GDP-L-fucose synthase